MTRPPVKTPAVEHPWKALPNMRTAELGATAQIMEPIMKTIMLQQNVHLREKDV